MSKLGILFITLAVLASCVAKNEDKVLVDKGLLDSLKNELNTCKELNLGNREENPKTSDLDLSGKYFTSSFEVTNSHQSDSRKYPIVIEKLISPGYSDPNEYKLRNFLGGGDQWLLEGEMKEGVLFIEGKDPGGLKSVSGTGLLRGNGIDTLDVKVKIIDSQNRTQEMNEIWVRNE